MKPSIRIDPGLSPLYAGIFIILCCLPLRAETICRRVNLHGESVTQCMSRSEFDQVQRKEAEEFLRNQRRVELENQKAISDFNTQYLRAVVRQGIKPDCPELANLAIRNASLYGLEEWLGYSVRLSKIIDRSSQVLLAETHSCKAAIIDGRGYIPFAHKLRDGWKYDRVSNTCFYFLQDGSKYFAKPMGGEAASEGRLWRDPCNQYLIDRSPSSPLQQ